ncbi:hypothetical protein S245_040106, partial [Arachis hypogaea]
EVKECAISCIGLIVSTLLSRHLLSLLLLQFGWICRVLEHVIVELTAFLRKANRALRQATLRTLNSLIVAYGDKIGSSAYESDLHMIALALELCCTLMSDKRSSPSVGLAIRNKVLPQALTLIKSSLLQGQALLALQNFFAALVYSANTISANEIDELCDEWVPEPLIPSLNEEPYAPPVLE